jgi:hypothetical protein
MVIVGKCEEQAMAQLHLKRLISQSQSPSPTLLSLLRVHGCLGLRSGAVKGPEIEEEVHSRVPQGEGIVYSVGTMVAVE